MAKSKAKPMKLAQRRATVASMYLEGQSQPAIAGLIGVSTATVCRDLQRLHREWVSAGLRDIDEIKSRELRRIDKLEAESWEAWRRSQEPEETKVSESVEPASGAKTKKCRTQRRGQVGDVRFLNQISWCISERLKITGGYAPAKIAPTSPDGEEAYHDHVLRNLSDEELQTLEVINERITTAG